MKPLKIYLADLTYTTLSLATEAFPLNIGYVAAYAKKKFGDQIELQLFKYLDDLDQAIRKDPPDILGMSNYPWNFNAGLQFFEFARSVRPETICVMGGPNIPLEDTSRDEFMRKHPLIDLYVYLEGEEAFANIIERVMEVGVHREKIKSRPVDGSLFCAPDGVGLIKGAFLKRRECLDDIPSPYLTGLMDKFFDGKLTPLLETNRGCPFSCIYCHEGNNLISKVNKFSMERVKAELDYCAKMVPPQVTNLMFADPNFGMYERDLEICEHIEGIQQRQNWPQSIFASTGKNKKEQIAKALRKLNGTMKLWMSVQSMDPVVLKEIKRSNIRLADMMSLSLVFEEMGLPTYSELILALPGETYDSHIESISSVVESGIDIISTYTLMLLNGTELTLKPTREKYGIKSHWRILPRDFGKLSNGKVAIEIEEVVTATNTLSFQEYQDARKFHLIVNSVYNGKGFGPLFKFFGENKIPVFRLLKSLVESMPEAPKEVRDLFEHFAMKTRNELWDSEEELREFASLPENYEKLLRGEIGENLIQTHNAKSMRIMGGWAKYIFMIAERICRAQGLSSEQMAMLNDIRSYCTGRVHNLWGDDREIDNPTFTMQFDIRSWSGTKGQSLEGFQFDQPRTFSFHLTDEKKREISAYVSRFGTTDTGIGRILTKMNVTSLWREPRPETSAPVHYQERQSASATA
jgi:radical SAM superfamily enzyme YgiQ (UPF0313 family)